MTSRFSLSRRSSFATHLVRFVDVYGFRGFGFSFGLFFDPMSV